MLLVYILIRFYSVSQSILLPNLLISSVLFINVSGLLLRTDVYMLKVVSKKDLCFVFPAIILCGICIARSSPLLFLCSLVSL